MASDACGQWGFATDAEIQDDRNELVRRFKEGPVVCLADIIFAKVLNRLRYFESRLAALEAENVSLKRALLHCYDGWQSGDSHIPDRCDACKEADSLIESAWGKDRVRG